LRVVYIFQNLLIAGRALTMDEN